MWETFCDYLENEIQHHHRCTSLTRDRRRLLLKIISEYRGHETLPITPENVAFMTLVFNHLFMIQSQIHWEASFQMITEHLPSGIPASIFPPNHPGSVPVLDPLLFSVGQSSFRAPARPASVAAASASIAHNPDLPSIFSGIETPVVPTFAQIPATDLFVRSSLSQDRSWDADGDLVVQDIDDTDSNFSFDANGHPVPDSHARPA